MPDRTKRRITIILLFILLAIALILLPLFSDEQEMLPSSDISSSSDNGTLTLRLYENELCLFRNREIVKKYDIDPSVLPGEDLKLLSNGIIVFSATEADTIAEDYDG